MKIGEALRWGASELSTSGVPESSMEAEFLLSEVLTLSRPELLRQWAEPLPENMMPRYERGLRERAKRKPLAYIVETAPFLDMTLRVSPDVLIPRPETELLSEKIAKELESAPLGQTIIDVGTGSGNLLISLIRHRHVVEGYGIDVSEAALKMAQENFARQACLKPCRWLQGDLLESLPLLSKPVWLVANLPYIRRADLAGLEPELHWEPRQALDGGESGLEIVYRLLDQAKKLPSQSVVWLEIGYDQAADVEKFLKTQGHWTDIRTEKDLAGWPRYVRAIRS